MKRFEKEKRSFFAEGFSLIELLVVLAIIGILAAIVLVSLSRAKEDAYLSKALSESRQIEMAVQMYLDDHGEYPVSPSLGEPPPGMDRYINPDIWNYGSGPWPGSTYVLNHWNPPDFPPIDEVFQISIRFCAKETPPHADPCRHPKNLPVEEQLTNPIHAVFWCIQGPCRSYGGNNLNIPGYCLNCREPGPPYGF